MPNPSLSDPHAPPAPGPRRRRRPHRRLDHRGLVDRARADARGRGQLVGSQRISLMASRVHWAMTYLAQAGLTDRPRRGLWCITDEGRRLLATAPERVDNAVLGRYESFHSLHEAEVGESLSMGGGVKRSACRGQWRNRDRLPSIDDVLHPILAVLFRMAIPHEFSAVPVDSVCDALHLDERSASVACPAAGGHREPARSDAHQSVRRRASSITRRPASSS